MLTEEKLANNSLECFDRLTLGLNRLAQGGIDAILLDLGLPDSQGLNTFTKTYEVAPKVPILVLTANDNDALALEAVGRGAQDFLIKGKIDGNVVSRAINYAVERKKKEEKLRVNNEKTFAIPASLRNPNIMSVLKAIKEGRVTKFTPSFSYERGLFYPDLEKIVPDSAIDCDIYKEIEKVGILKREFYDAGLACPSCGSLKVSLRVACTNCGSANIEKETAIEHLHCGHIDKYEKFVSGEKLFCPHCNRELKALGVDYRRPGLLLKCGACGNMMPNPIYKYICGDCNGNLTADKLDIKKFFTFVVEIKDEALLDAWVSKFDESLV
jgi:CheY-like chemotaxis protein/transcription elongation factor Elf1